MELWLHEWMEHIGGSFSVKYTIDSVVIYVLLVNVLQLLWRRAAFASSFGTLVL